MSGQKDGKSSSESLIQIPSFQLPFNPNPELLHFNKSEGNALLKLLVFPSGAHFQTYDFGSSSTLLLY